MVPNAPRYSSTLRYSALAQTLLGRSLLRGDAPIAGVIDWDALRDTILTLKTAFPSHFRHAFAAKANCMPGVLSFIKEAGMACEVASTPELLAAETAGFRGPDIVFDSPAKTNGDLRRALLAGATLFLDNYQEMARVDDLLRQTVTASTIGVRINPQVGAGAISSTSTAALTSKFGIGLRDSGNLDSLIAAFVTRPWLSSLHVHVGSQGCPLELTAQGVKEVVHLGLTINRACGHERIGMIDIGGGLPVNFSDDTVVPTFDEYGLLLRRVIPELFDATLAVTTEFGRSIIAKAGFTLARVEYTKVMGGRRIAITHAGAQIAARTVYQPDTWPLRITALDASGRLKYGQLIEQDIAGPCCFAGDILAHERRLPLLEPGDHILVHDTGGYYFSSPYLYNSLPPIDVFGATGPDDSATLRALAPASFANVS
jgi:diaminopimelate decarboxylase